MPRPTCRFAALTLSLALFAATAHALEYPIGTPQNVGGLEVAAVDLQPIEMEPDDGHMRKASESDIHLEADIRALANNPNGFAEGAWVPYLQVRFELTKVGSGEVIKGAMMPMVASDGPKTEGDHLHFRSRFRLHSPLLQRSRKAPASGLPPGSTGAAVADAGDPQLVTAVTQRPMKNPREPQSCQWRGRRAVASMAKPPFVDRALPTTL